MNTAVGSTFLALFLILLGIVLVAVGVRKRGTQFIAALKK